LLTVGLEDSAHATKIADKITLVRASNSVDNLFGHRPGVAHMATTQARLVLRHIRELAAAKAAVDVSDGELLERFIRGHEESAFEALVKRHGPMVLGVCQRILHHRDDAEDAWQATFLVLARKAASIGQPASVGSWLYKVAYHMAARARKQAAARQKRESHAAARSAPDPLAEVTGRELLTLLDEELQNLPDRYRAPLVHCYLEGQTRDEAARQLGCSRSTINRRLELGKEKLRRQLAKRGLSLSAILLTLALTQSKAGDCLAAPLARATITAGLATAARGAIGGLVSPRVAELANGALRAMGVAKLKIATALLLATGLTVFTASATALHVRAPAEAAGETAAVREPAQAPEPTRPIASAEQGERMTVRGRVLDPDGKPLPAAQVAVLAGVRRFGRYGSLSNDRALLGQAKTDADGGFSLTVPRTSSMHNWAADVIAKHPKYGLHWQSFDPDAERPDVTVSLLAEQVISGQLMDIQGQPAAGVKLQLARVGREDKLDARMRTEARIAAEKKRAEGNTMQMRKDVFLQNDEIFLHDPIDGFTLWPRPMITDKDGRFVLHGIGRGMSASLYVHDERFAFQSVDIRDTSKAEIAGSVRRTLDAARILEGRITCADTGKPAANVEVRGWGWGSRAHTDADGRYRVNSARGPQYSGDEVGILMVFPPHDQPYCNIQKEFHWPKGVVKHSLDIALPRGVLVRGKVTEEGTGKPVASAQVRYWTQQNNPNLKAEDMGPYNFVNGKDMTASAADGTFRIACRPGPGYLMIEGPDADYVLRENGGQRRLFTGKRGGQPWRAHGFVDLDTKAGGDPIDVSVTLCKGVTICGEVAGPDGKPVQDLDVFCRLDGFNTHPVKVRGSRFELHGCDPAEPIMAFFLNSPNSWGTTVKLSAKDRDKPVRVQLSSLGSARVRFIDKEGKPRVNFYPGLFLVLAPKQGDLDAQTQMIASPFRRVGPHTDDDGYCMFTNLIPGATYQFGHAEIKTTFTAESGKVVQVEDVVVGDRGE
jgi:RNA polymerase sigma factor (sigma-70 family)